METRSIYQLYPFEQEYFDYIDIRLKELFFRDLEITISPWTTGEDLENEVKKNIDASKLCDEVKRSIKVKCSDLHGQINM